MRRSLVRPSRTAHLASAAAFLGALLALPPNRAAAQGAAEGALCRQAQSRGAGGAEARARLEPLSRSGATSAFFDGCAQLAAERLGPAADAFERAVAAADASAEAHYWLGVVYGQQAQRANVFKQGALAGKTKRHLERAVQLNPDHLDARAGLMQFYLLAPGFMGGDKGKAREQAREIQRRNAYRGGFALASIASRDKDWATAAGAYTTLAKQFPDSAAPWTSLAAMYGQQKRWSEAFATVDAFLAAQPSSMSAQYALGRTAAESGEQLDRGAQALERYLTHTPVANEPALASAHLRLGQIEEKRGRKDAARAQYTSALSADPKLKAAQDGLERVK